MVDALINGGESKDRCRSDHARGAREKRDDRNQRRRIPDHFRCRDCRRSRRTRGRGGSRRGSHRRVRSVRHGRRRSPRRRGSRRRSRGSSTACRIRSAKILNSPIRERSSECRSCRSNR